MFVCTGKIKCRKRLFNEGFSKNPITGTIDLHKQLTPRWGAQDKSCEWIEVLELCIVSMCNYSSMLQFLYKKHTANNKINILFLISFQFLYFFVSLNTMLSQIKSNKCWNLHVIRRFRWSIATYFWIQLATREN